MPNTEEKRLIMIDTGAFYTYVDASFFTFLGQRVTAPTARIKHASKASQP